MCVKNTTMVPQWSMVTTPRVMEHIEILIGKTNTPLMKEFLLALIKKITTLVLSSTIADIL